MSENTAKIAARRLLNLPVTEHTRELVKATHALNLLNECTNLDVIAIVQEHLQRKGGAADE